MSTRLDTRLARAKAAKERAWRAWARAYDRHNRLDLQRRLAAGEVHHLVDDYQSQADCGVMVTPDHDIEGLPTCLACLAVQERELAQMREREKGGGA